MGLRAQLRAAVSAQRVGLRDDALRFLIADEQALVGDGMRTMLAVEPDIESSVDTLPLVAGRGAAWLAR
jgi:hypothetical protein